MFQHKKKIVLGGIAAILIAVTIILISSMQGKKGDHISVPLNSMPVAASTATPATLATPETTGELEATIDNVQPSVNIQTTAVPDPITNATETDSADSKSKRAPESAKTTSAPSNKKTEGKDNTIDLSDLEEDSTKKKPSPSAKTTPGSEETSKPVETSTENPNDEGWTGWY